MNEKLIIRNFGPIKDVELDLRKINIFIGDQGTGKSTVAKVLYAVKSASYRQTSDLTLSDGHGGVVTDINQINTYKNNQFIDEFNNVIELLDIKGYWNRDNESYIYFENSFCEVIIEGNNIQFKPVVHVDESTKDKNTNLNYYIPAFRESYILLRNNYPAILNAKANLPFLLNSFGQRFNNSRENQLSFDYNSILNITYSFENGRDIIQMDDGNEIKFEESSSAINSVVPMLVVADGICNEMRQNTYRIFYKANRPFITIEEPELNCFPNTQNELVKHLIENIKNPYENDLLCNLLITTHSPYILTSLNNSMFAYQAGQIDKVAASDIIEEKYWVNPKDVSCYMMQEGGAVSIIDEDGQIMADYIDSISVEINNEYLRLNEIKIKHGMEIN